jgi:hypothetical protein
MADVATRTRQPSTVDAPARTKQPNLFEVSGYGIQVTYSTTSLNGQPQFNYQDAHQSMLFVGDQILTETTEIGTLVSVMLRQTPDAGSTEFTLVVPRINLRQFDTVNINTIGITTLHKTTIAGPPHGQSDFYTVHQLQGTASLVTF